MSNKKNEPNTWRFYDDSSLVTFLRYDTWDALTAIALICEIDPRHSEHFNPKLYYKTPLVESIMVDETRPYWRIKLLSVNKTAHVPRCWYQDVDDIQAASMDWERSWKEWGDKTSPYISLEDTIAPQIAAENQIVEVHGIFFSSPVHVDKPTRSPRYFVDWALSKGIEIRWLEWAKARGYLVQDSIESQLKTKESPAKKAPSAKAPERNREKEQQIVELRARAVKIAIKLKRDGIATKHITIRRICEDLFKESFSSSKPFKSRWKDVEGMRSHLKGEHHPKATDEFRTAKPDRGNFSR